MSDTLSPLDVKNRRFDRKMKGYDPAQVDAFMQAIRETLETLYRRLDDMERTVREQKDRLSDYQRLEATLRETLTTAQTMSERLTEAARKEAEAILGQAEVEADRRLRSLEARKAELIAQIHELKRERITFEARLESLLSLHGRLLDTFRQEEERLDKVEDALTFVPKTKDAAGEGGL